MADLYCKNITSVRRSLPAGSRLLLGDQIIGGSAIKSSLSGDTPLNQSADEDLYDQIAEQAFGVDASLNPDLYNLGEEITDGFITEGGFEAGIDGVDVIHSGMGGEARFYAPGTQLFEGDLLLNGSAIDENGNEIVAPARMPGRGTAGVDGAVTSPDGAAAGLGPDDQAAFCSLQELAGTPAEGSRLDDFLSELELDLEIPGLDFSWWVEIQTKLNELMAIQGKFIAKTQNLVNLVELDPGDACKYVPNVEKLIALIQRVMRTINTIRMVLDKINKMVKLVKKALKLLKWIFAPIRIVEAFLMILQVIEGFPIMLNTAVKNLTDTSKVLPQLLALLQKILAQCASNRGAEAGLTKEQCEAAGGVYIERLPGDLGAARTGGGADDLSGMIDALAGEMSGFDIDTNNRSGFMPEGTDLVAGDIVEDGNVNMNGSDMNLDDYPFIVPFGDDTFSAGAGGITGNGEGIDLRESHINALLDSQILDLQDCMTEIDKMDRTRNFS